MGWRSCVGVYRDRVGCAAVLTNSSQAAQLATRNLASLARLNYSFPPNHGAATVSTVLDDQALKENWMSELEEMRLRILRNRRKLAAVMRVELKSDRFDFVERHRGMFSLLGLTTIQIDTLRQQYAIFMPGDGRLNVAGLLDRHIGTLSHALAKVVQQT